MVNFIHFFCPKCLNEASVEEKYLRNHFKGKVLCKCGSEMKMSDTGVTSGYEGLNWEQYSNKYDIKGARMESGVDMETNDNIRAYNKGNVLGGGTVYVKKGYCKYCKSEQTIRHFVDGKEYCLRCGSKLVD